MYRLALLAALVVSGLAIAVPAQAQLRVFACEPEWAALARELGGPDLKATSATHARQDPHYIRARPSMIARIRRADLLICSGGGLEVGWLPILLQQGASASLQPGQPGSVMAVDYVTVLGKPKIIDRSHGDVHPEGNPHVHLDPANIALIAQEITRRLGVIDPGNADTYRQRSAAFLQNWSRSQQALADRAVALKGMPVIVHHKTWSYLVQWLGLDQRATLEVRPGIEPTPGHLQKLLAMVREKPVKAIIRTPYDAPWASDWLSSKTGIPVLTLPYTVEKDAGEGALAELFARTIAQLEAANGAR